MTASCAGTSSRAAASTARRLRCRSAAAPTVRRRPLLLDDADWDALGDGLHSLCRELDEAEAVQLLGVLEAAGDDPEVLALARLALARLGWSGKAVSVDAIAAWMPLAQRLDPRLEPPAVAMTWLELEPDRAPHTPEELERFADWLRLAETALAPRRRPARGGSASPTATRASSPTSRATPRTSPRWSAICGSSRSTAWWSSTRTSRGGPCPRPARCVWRKRWRCRRRRSHSSGSRSSACSGTC